ncbi:ribonuclease HII [soil metagenome]
MPNAERPGSKSDDSAARVSLFPGARIKKPGLHFEKQAYAEGFRLVAGVDEVGRGCLAGPVVAAACILDPVKRLPKGLNDSKKLTPKLREEIAEKLKSVCVAYAIGQVEADEIDEINILEATKKAMRLAIQGLGCGTDYLLIDAVRLKDIDLPQMPIIRGDSISASIAAASVLAKTYRDALMVGYHGQFPSYGFDGHKGYAASVHLDALREHGPCRIHRMSFHGVVDEVPHSDAQPLLIDMLAEPALR